MRPPPHVLVTYVQADGSAQTCRLAPGESVMDGALDNGVPGIVAQCGGGCTCATCHCYVRSPWFERLPEPIADERDMLAYVAEPRRNSRLSCQVRVTGALDGMIVDVPERQA
ncbi:MAG: 2Fe-2S iron-sulfur cluster-binding protein [Pseudomonadales bacterium]